MKKQKLYAGIDLHSNNLMLAIVNASGKRIAHQRLACDIGEVEKYLKGHDRDLEAIALESTFNWYWLVDGLQDRGYDVRLANPAGMEQYDGLKAANDKTDAYFIAELLRLGILPQGHIYDRRLRPVRDMLRRRAGLVSKRTSLILSLRNLPMRNHAVALESGMIKASGLWDLVAMFSNPADKLVVEVQKRLIDELGTAIRRIEREVMRTVQSLPRFEEVALIPGLGKILTMTILLEIGDINRFASAENLASYARTVKAGRLSNNKKKGENNRKCGNRYLSWAFVEAANFTRRYDRRAALWHARKARRTHKVVATKALACKLAKAVWHVLKHGSAYDGDRLFGPLPDEHKEATKA